MRFPCVNNGNEQIFHYRRWNRIERHCKRRNLNSFKYEIATATLLPRNDIINHEIFY
jgi:hypothetical protein